MPTSPLLSRSGEPAHLQEGQQSYVACLLPDCTAMFRVLMQVIPGLPFFASKVLLGPQGIAKVLGVGELDAFEKAALEAMLPQLKGEIAKGVEFVLSPPAPVATA